MSSVVAQLALRLSALQWKMSTAESCTGGMIAASCTDLAGSSAWFDCGFVTYANEAKSQMLGVPMDLISTHGAVSELVARAMALGAVYRSQAQVALAVTGVAGPTGGSPEKPTGTVWLAWCIEGVASAQLMHFDGDRQQVRLATTAHALQGLLQRLPK